MNAYRAALLALVVLLGTLVSVVPASAMTSVDATTEGTGPAVADADAVESARPVVAQNESANNSSLGADISSFMQSSAAEVDGAVETGMWSAAFNGTDNQSARVQLVERRTSELRAQLTDLREEKADLIAEREAGNISETAYKARISRLVGQINALQSAINTTSSGAKEVGADAESLTTLRTEAKNLTGPEISRVARNVTGVDTSVRGPPADVGNGVNGSERGSSGPPADTGQGNGAAGAGPGNTTTVAGPANNTTAAGLAPNATGPATNRTGQGPATNRTGQGLATNTSSVGPANNTTGVGPTNNTTTPGDLDNTTTAGPADTATNTSERGGPTTLSDASLVGTESGYETTGGISTASTQTVVGI